MTILREVATGVHVHASTFMQSNSVIVDGDAGVLLIDAGVLDSELAAIAHEVGARGEAVVAGFSTHPHWDHLLWHPSLGSAPRYGTATCAAVVGARLGGDDWKDLVRSMIPAEIVDSVPLDDTTRRVTGLPAGATSVPWDGPAVRIIEHNAHAPGHAAVLISDGRVLVAGDMLSDTLVPMLNAMAPDPIGDYLAALDLLEDAAADIHVVIPGHGSVGDAAEMQRRVAQDRAYLHALREGRLPDDARLAAPAPYAAEMMGITERQLAAQG